VGDTITQKIVSWDPETASQAEIEEMISELDKITTEAGNASGKYTTGDPGRNPCGSTKLRQITFRR